jgi:hypothetical protein
MSAIPVEGLASAPLDELTEQKSFLYRLASQGMQALTFIEYRGHKEILISET